MYLYCMHLVGHLDQRAVAHVDLGLAAVPTSWCWTSMSMPASPSSRGPSRSAGPAACPSAGPGSSPPCGAAGRPGWACRSCPEFQMPSSESMVVADLWPSGRSAACRRCRTRPRGPSTTVSAMPLVCQVALGLARDVARVAAVRLAADRARTMSQIRLSVGTSQAGSTKAVVGSGMSSMSLSWIVLEAADAGAVEADALVEQVLAEVLHGDA